eukprot:CAMPEP_0195572500 /NCGR_PEP_ID=MMETSP0814-20130614/4773_1 /TAXON_ID=97485 /ORGANISM="Prymnesium parvum, Strain Texoma1" /LENGTH=73 /DNA_ID=CAMNT_0040708271 /DNA_START=609 /DNA_END=830 /DNA_ORIENTATION=-
MAVRVNVACDRPVGQPEHLASDRCDVTQLRTRIAATRPSQAENLEWPVLPIFIEGLQYAATLEDLVMASAAAE